MKKFWKKRKLPKFSFGKLKFERFTKFIAPMKQWWQHQAANNQYIIAAKKWWDNLAAREQRIVKWGSVAACVLTYIFVFWQPIHDKIDELQVKNQRQHELLLWMQQAERKLKRGNKVANKKRVKVVGSLLTTIDNSIRQNQLSNDASEIKKVDNKQVQVKFKSVGFKRLMSWLQKLQSKYLINIAKTTMRRTDKAGMVQVDLVISSDV